MPASSSFGITLLMMSTGIGIPIMAALNAGLGARIGSPWLAAFILFFVCMVVSGIVVGIIGVPTPLALKAPAPYFAGGILVAFYVLSITWAAPRIGIGNAVFLVLLGQIASAAIIDHFGLFGVVPSPLGMRRLAGIGFMALGVFLARRL